MPKRGEVDAVSFRPTEKFNPITWVGKVDRADGAEESSERSSGGGFDRGPAVRQ